MHFKETKYTDPELLVSGAYRDPALIEKRRALYKFTSPYHNVNQEVIRYLNLKRGDKVLDVGCGEGKFIQDACLVYPDSHFVGLDISAEMFEDAKRLKMNSSNVEFAVGDIQSMGFDNRSFQRVTAMHMLYHVPDIHGGISEMARVLSNDGICLITANSLRSKPTKRELKMVIAEMLGRNSYPDPSERFNVENGDDILRTFFRNVRLITYESRLKLTDPTPYVEYFDSLKEFWNPLPNPEEWSRSLSLVRESIVSKIRERDSFEEANIFGLFICSKPIYRTSALKS